MADLGLAGAGRAMGAAGALRQMIMDRMAALQAAAAENDRQQQLAQTAKFQDAQITSMADERAANAALRKQNAAHTLTQDLVPGSVLDPTATGTLQAGNLGSLVEHQTPVLGSTSTTGATTLPSPSQPMQAALTSMSEAAHGAQDVYSGTPSQQRTVQTQNMLKGMLRSLPPDSPEAKSLSYRMMTGANPPAGMFDKQTTHMVPIAGPHGPTYINESDAAGKPVYERPQAVPTVTIQTTDAQGNPVTRVMPKADALGHDFAKPDPMQVQVQHAHMAQARTTLDKLDQDINAVSTQIGPIGGRISDLEQQIGNPDPKISTLATRMLAAKMLVDSGLGGMRAAASPQLLAKWDHVLSMKLNPENLHATVAVMRDMVSPAGSSPTTSAGPKVGDVVSVRGQKIQITALHPDGSFDGNPVK